MTLNIGYLENRVERHGTVLVDDSEPFVCVVAPPTEVQKLKRKERSEAESCARKSWKQSTKVESDGQKGRSRERRSAGLRTSKHSLGRCEGSTA